MAQSANTETLLHLIDELGVQGFVEYAKGLEENSDRYKLVKNALIALSSPEAGDRSEDFTAICDAVPFNVLRHATDSIGHEHMCSNVDDERKVALGATFINLADYTKVTDRPEGKLLFRGDPKPTLSSAVAGIARATSQRLGHDVLEGTPYAGEAFDTPAMFRD